MTESIADHSRVLHLPRNTRGRDFVVGDIHGMFATLKKLLGTIEFVPERDRLLCVGDLVDRGPDSPRALVYLHKPWFYTIRGNHEDMLLRHFEDPDNDSLYDQWMVNGGSWWEHTTEPVRRMLYRSLRHLPLAMDVDTERGLVGITHADLPADHNWATFLAALVTGDERTEATALWSRQRARLWRVAGPVPDVEDIYCGHTIVKAPLSAGNVHFIDTGAYHPSFGHLTAVDLGLGVESATSVAP